MKYIFVRLKAYFLNRKLKYESLSDSDRILRFLRSIDNSFFLILMCFMILVSLVIYVVSRLSEVGII